MNERIWELYGQALVGVSEAGGDVLDPVKFAELIVRECANVLTARAMFYDGFGDLQIRAQTMETAADLVKYHFGVTQN